jgi:putative FmdB family regulatory protein
LTKFGGFVPTYSYACTECDNRFDAVQAFTDDALTACPKCNGRLRKLFGKVGVVFKGSGFYRTDNRESAKTASNGSASSSESSNSSTSEKSSDKPAEKSKASDKSSSSSGSSDKSSSDKSSSSTAAASS